MWSAVKFKRSLIELITNTRRTNKKSVGVYFYDAITLSHRDKVFQNPFPVSASPLALAVFKARTSGSMASENRPNVYNTTNLSAPIRPGQLLARTLMHLMASQVSDSACETKTDLEWDATLDYYANNKDWCGIDRVKSCCCVNTYSDHRVIKNNSLQ